MKKILFSLFIAVFSLYSATAQTTITNGNMEGWDNPTGQNAEPANWNSTKSASGTYAAFTPQTCWRDASTLNGGTYCAKISTIHVTLGNTDVNGVLTTGQVIANSTVKAEGYIKTQTADATHRMDFTGRPDSLVFWYKYTPTGTDYPSVEARLHTSNCEAPEIPVNGNHALDTANIVARAQWQGSTSTIATWTRVAVPFVYRNGTTPQYILFTCTSSGDALAGVPGSNLWLDEFSVVYNPTIATGTINPTTYYVSALTGTSVTVPFTLTGTYNGGNTITAELSDASGSFAAPISIGSVVATTSGNLTATIPANTASGTGYRIRVVSSSPALTAASNGSDITVVLVGNSVAPSATQNIAANTTGAALTVTESGTASSREWKYSTTSGGSYGSFGPAETATTYTPNFAGFGTYYVVCVSSFPGGLTVTSNEVTINVVENSIAPTASQSILVGVPGTMLTVTENPAASSREWYYATASGGPYTMVTPMQMGTTYTPNFASAGTYYVVCESIINGVTAISNEVQINVGNATITTGVITGSPFLFSATHADASVTVPYTTSGTFNNGNIFTAQLSDASGSFASAVNIGTVTATTSGSIAATIDHTTAAGTGYRIRVISDNPVVLGSDNGTDLVIDQFNNSVAPATTQSIMHGANGSAVSVTESQPAIHEWKYSSTSGSGYVSFAPAETGSSYTPNFALPGTYYVVCVSTNVNPGDAVTSNEVEIDVQNGATITTSTVSGSPFLVSASMPAAVSVDFTSDVVFNAGNVFTAQLSDYNGSFTNATAIGTLSGATIGTISASIPGNTTGSTNYRIRVISTDPAVTGSDNGTNLEVVPFANFISPIDTQHLIQNQNGNAIAVTENQSATHLWKWTQASGLAYTNFSPSETGTSLIPHFNLVSPYYIVCESTNGANDKVVSQEVVVIVTSSVGIGETSNEMIKAYWRGNDFVADLSSTKLIAPVLELINVQGQVVAKEKLNASSINTIATHLPSGVYLFRILENDKVYLGKVSKN